jgi:peptidoglycan/xylan/chitin deacetylase (PgdA/CDA1 family)
MMKQLTYLLIGLVLGPCTGSAQAQTQGPESAKEKIVVLTFDDAVKSQFTFVAPLLRKYGFGATFFVCEFPPDFEDTTKYMTWAEIKQLAYWGFDIGNHTRHHLHVDDLSADSLREEITYIDRKCDSLGIPHPVHFAYPGYVTDPAKIPLFRQLGYHTARTGGNKVYHPGLDSPFFIPSFTPGDDLDKALDAAGQAGDGKVVILTIHGVPDLAHSWVSTSPAVFEGLLKFLAAGHYTVLSMRGLEDSRSRTGDKNRNAVPAPDPWITTTRVGPFHNGSPALYHSWPRL